MASETFPQLEKNEKKQMETLCTRIETNIFPPKSSKINASKKQPLDSLTVIIVDFQKHQLSRRNIGTNKWVPKRKSRDAMDAYWQKNGLFSKRNPIQVTPTRNFKDRYPNTWPYLEGVTFAKTSY